MAIETVQFADTPNFDAFGRLRVSQPASLFDNMAEYGNDTAYWETLVSGGSATHVANQCAVRLSTGGATAGQYAYRQTRQYLRYQPGRSLNIETTFVMGATPYGSRSRIGYFDEKNGIFLESTRGVGSADLFAVNPLVYTGLNSVQDILTLAVQTLTGSGTANGSITWVEEY